MRPNFRVLGKRLGGKMKAVTGRARARPTATRWPRRWSATAGSSIAVDGESIELGPDELEVRLIEKEGLATAGDRELLVALDTAAHARSSSPRAARARWSTACRRARKEAGLDYADRIRVRYRAAPELEAAIAAHRDWIAGETLAVDWQRRDGAELEAAPVDGLDFAFAIERAG